MSLARVVLMLHRLTGMVQLLLGIVFWTGHALGLINLHIAIGGIFVLLLWTIAGIGLIKHVGLPLVALAVAWGIVVVAFGMTQQRFLIGDLHWIIRVLHVAVASVAMMLSAAIDVRLHPRQAAIA